MSTTISVQVCQACGLPSTSGWSHDLGEGDVYELCGRCADVSDAISRLGFLGHADAAGFAARRERVMRIVELLQHADELVDERYGDQPSRLSQWFNEEDGDGSSESA